LAWCLPEQRALETEIVQNYPLDIIGHSSNLGILGGFDYIANALDTDYILILENDFHTLSAPNETQKALDKALYLLENNHAHIVRLRSRDNPGDPFCGQYKYKKYFPDSNSFFIKKLYAWFMRQIMPYHSQKTLGMIFYDLQKDPKNYPNIFHFHQNIPITNTHFLPWTNNPCLVKRDFLIKQVLEFAKNYPSKRRVNGFKNLEIETNSKLWRQNSYNIALPSGIFTHNRIGHRGY